MEMIVGLLPRSAIDYTYNPKAFYYATKNYLTTSPFYKFKKWSVSNLDCYSDKLTDVKGTLTVSIKT